MTSPTVYRGGHFRFNILYAMKLWRKLIIFYELDELLTTMNIEHKTPEIKIALEKGVRSLLSKSLSTVNVPIENSTNN